MTCLAKGGIAHFTVENICNEAKVSKGLVVHHFGSKEELAAAVYAAAYDRMLTPVISTTVETGDVRALVEWLLSALPANPQNLRIWLALWGEIAVNPHMRLEHRKHYALYKEAVARSLSAVARQRGVPIDTYGVAIALIALVDGIWLEQCLDTSSLRSADARDLCVGVVESALRSAQMDRSVRPEGDPQSQGRIEP